MDGVRDIFGNVILETKTTNCTEIISDSRSPKLQSFDFEYDNDNIYTPDAYTLTLRFSSAINVDSFDCSDFILVSAPNVNADEIVNLDSSNCHLLSVEDSSSVQIAVSKSEFSDLTLGNMVQTDWHLSTYLYTRSNAEINSRGLNNKKIQIISLYRAIRVGPRLIDFFLDLSSGQLTLLYSKPVVRTGSFNSSRIGLYSRVTSRTEFLVKDNYALNDYFDENLIRKYRNRVPLPLWTPGL